MPRSLHFISRKDLFDLFGRLAESRKVFVPYKAGGGFSFGEFDPAKEDAIELGGVRQSQPLKAFLFPARESVMEEAPFDTRSILLAGVKACDLSSLAVQDYVFQGPDTEDPFYKKNRQSIFVIASDCTYARKTCFCLAMEGAPYPDKNFDLLLSCAGDGFLVETGSGKGSKLISDFKMFFKPAEQALSKEREEARRRVSSEVRGFIDAAAAPDTAAIKGKMKDSYDNTELWKDQSSACVECGACNLVCPTCHCFLLFDEKKTGRLPGRFRIWDSCLYKTFARVAGGANPRRHLYERLRNRFDKKFAFFPETLGRVACTGCGRCIDACPGKIDIREVLKGIVAGKWKKPPHE